jgi:tripartite-type tricarboxylate transporter receptor subunit TctC
MTFIRLPIDRRLLAGLFVGLVAAVAGAGAAQAQAYPNRAVRIVVPFPPGGINDTVARLIGPSLEKALGKPIVIDNRAGASGIVGTDAVVKSAPDGHTLLMVASSHTVTPATNSKLPYSTERDLAAVAAVSKNPMLFVINNKLTARTLGEFVTLAKAEGGKLNYATVGAASQSHLVTELFGQKAGIRMQHIPYRGGAPAITSLMTGETHFAVLSPQVSLPHIEAGTVRAIAAGSPVRDPQFPDLPTVAESGFPGFEAMQWVGLLAPAGTSREIIDRVNAEVNRALRDPEVIAKLAQQGMAPAGGTPDEFDRLIAAEVKQWTEVARAADIKAE